jgi:pimeloyl-ACP methyl ester carboxylesterase
MEPTYNDKPTVILVHGMWSNQDTLKEVQQVFTDQGYETDALCLPYHYPKETFTNDIKNKLARTRLQDYVEYIVEKVKQQSRPPILIGHSMGGLLVQLVAVQVPCNRLILLSSAAPAGINGLSLSAIRTLGHNIFSMPLWKNVTDVSLKSIQYGIANSQSPELQQELYSSCTYESGMATFQISMGALLRRFSAAHVNTNKIKCPVLIVGGTEDRITPIDVQRKIAKNFGSRAHLVEVPGCCHWTVSGEYFPVICSEISSWLES